MIWEFLLESKIDVILVRFLLAVLGGGIIGWERGKTQHAAGLRTHILVCMGAASVMMLNIHLYQDHATGDITRLGAQVISGIGFLGAGTILVRGENRITGLTTAASLWASACMGLAVGSGFYAAAIVMTILIYLVLVLMNKLDEHFLKRKRMQQLYVELAPNIPFSVVIRGLREEDIRIQSIEVLANSNRAAQMFLLSAQVERNNTDLNDALMQLRQKEGVLYTSILSS